ncbi:MAG: EF-P beta-lysylation protein EpmB [Pirellulales bacterium]|nr:EF-P beta-lysylation protein EpmB [Pirellulales bacterium]
MPVPTCRTVPLDRYLTPPDYPDWQSAAADAVRDPVELCRLLELPTSLAAVAQRAGDGFPLLVPRTYLSRIRVGDANDPLLLQILPREGELAISPRFTRDPIGEADSILPGGALWKYQNRVLMVTTGVCAVHCRFCFRRHFPYEEAVREARRWQNALERIAREASIHEVILSGGDPLSMSDQVLARLVERLDAIRHLRRLRVHTRQPVLIPQRVTRELVHLLRASRLTAIVVLHINHLAEIDRAVDSAIGQLVDAGIPILQQGVLLRGINDRLETLAELYERLVDLRVMPYYLHQLDRVAGAAHFEVPEEEGMRLIEQLRARLPGYAVPRLVREVAGAPNKVVLA